MNSIEALEASSMSSARSSRTVRRSSFPQTKDRRQPLVAAKLSHWFAPLIFARSSRLRGGMQITTLPLSRRLTRCARTRTLACRCERTGRALPVPSQSHGPALPCLLDEDTKAHRTWLPLQATMPATIGPIEHMTQSNPPYRPNQPKTTAATTTHHHIGTDTSDEGTLATERDPEASPTVQSVRASARQTAISEFEFTPASQLRGGQDAQNHNSSNEEADR